MYIFNYIFGVIIGKIYTRIFSKYSPVFLCFRMQTLN